MAKKKLFQVIKATRREINGISIDGKTMNFGKKFGAFSLSDPGLAAEIKASYGPKGSDAPGQVVVVPVDGPRGREPGHKYTFTVPELPWKNTPNQGNTPTGAPRVESEVIH